jgi:tRNA A37 threonylcarbamoyladenosine synthetase subunit TsaC/SUA5/YrdC
MIAVEPSVVPELRGRGWVGVRLKVVEGSISVGILNKSAQKFLTAANLSARPEPQTIYLVVDDLSDIGSVMVSNDRPRENRPSVVELHAVQLKRFGANGSR